jgi:hypothetical protein
VPALPGSAQERQVPEHELPQQTPCWQRPDWHSLALVQATPFSFFEQTPPLHTLLPAQSVEDAQLVRQVPLLAQR